MEGQAIITNKTGLHARPAANFVKTASKYKCDIRIEKGSNRVNAKSIIGVMSLGASQGTEVKIIAEGEDEKQALDALIELIENSLGE